MGAEGLLVIFPVLTMRTEVCMCLASEAKDMKDTYTTHHLRKRQVSDMQIRLCAYACAHVWMAGWMAGRVGTCRFKRVIAFQTPSLRAGPACR
jgi:hypothetical protein